MSWYYLKEHMGGGDPVGPFTDQQIAQLAAEGVIKKSTGILHPKMTAGQWIDAKDSVEVMGWIDAPRLAKEAQKRAAAEKIARERAEAVRFAAEQKEIAAERARKAVEPTPDQKARAARLSADKQIAERLLQESEEQKRHAAEIAPLASPPISPPPLRTGTSWKTWVIRTAIGLALIAVLQGIGFVVFRDRIIATEKKGLAQKQDPQRNADEGQDVPVSVLDLADGDRKYADMNRNEQFVLANGLNSHLLADAPITSLDPEKVKLPELLDSDAMNSIENMILKAPDDKLSELIPTVSGNLHFVAARMIARQFDEELASKIERAIRSTRSNDVVSELQLQKLARKELSIVLPFETGEGMLDGQVRQITRRCAASETLADGAIIVLPAGAYEKPICLRWFARRLTNVAIEPTNAAEPYVWLFCGEERVLNRHGKFVDCRKAYALSWTLLHRCTLMQGRRLIDDLPEAATRPSTGAQWATFLSNCKEFSKPTHHQNMK